MGFGNLLELDDFWNYRIRIFGYISEIQEKKKIKRKKVYKLTSLHSLLFKEIVYWRLPIHLFSTDWLCELALRLKDQNLNPLWTDLICSKFWLPCQLHFFRDLQLVRRIPNLHFHHPHHYLCRLLRKFRSNLFNIQWSGLVGYK